MTTLFPHEGVPGQALAYKIGAPGPTFSDTADPAGAGGKVDRGAEAVRRLNMAARAQCAHAYISLARAGA